jgi:hypothetical protein
VLYSFAVRAVRASQEPASRGVLNKLKSIAERNESPCYICGVALDYTTTKERNSYTCEHVWPQNYGGDSIPENFLPACGDCNWKFKKDFATWTMLSVQALIRGLDPSEAGLGSVESHYRIALHYRAAQSYAVRHRMTLREAFLAAGPWHDVRVLDRGDTADFFNLANHDPALEID